MVDLVLLFRIDMWGVLANKFDTMYFDNDKAKYKWL